jgi:DNA-directed RNA polymerase specialized sigma24 family protein
MAEVIAWKLWYNRIRQRSTLACVSPMQSKETGWPSNDEEESTTTSQATHPAQGNLPEQRRERFP